MMLSRGNGIAGSGLAMSIRSTITSQFEQVAREQQRQLVPLSDDLKLLESGLDSLSFALIVARLEDAVGFDPFDTEEPVQFPVTFGDFVRLYENRGK
jgi:acyl carrier protein